MEFPLMGLVRLAALAGLGLGMAAVGLGRMNSESADRNIPAPVWHAGFGGHNFGFTPGGTRLLNLKSGELERLALADSEMLDYASCAPWADGHGEVQVVGLRAKLGEGFIACELGLTRLTFPSGRVLDRVATEILPGGPPCWYPGGGPRILYASCDGLLYHYTFGEADDREVDTAPQELTWRRRPPGFAAVRVIDPTWPDFPALGGRLLVALNGQPADGRGRYEGSKLWWLQLNPAGTEIVAARRLTRPDPSAGPDREDEERLPAVGRSATGSLLLAYLARSQGEQNWRVCVAPLRVGPHPGEPFVSTSEARVVAEDCVPLTPSFALNGRWVTCLHRSEAASHAIRRVPLVDPRAPRAL